MNKPLFFGIPRSFSHFAAIALLLLMPCSLSAVPSTFVINGDGRLLPKTEAFVDSLSSELFMGSGISLYVAAFSNLGGLTLQEHEEKLQKELRKPYVVLLFSQSEKKIDIFTSDAELAAMIDKKSIYWDHIVPLIPKKESDLSPSNISAMLLNGYLAIAQRISLRSGISLSYPLARENGGSMGIARVIIYIMLLTLLGLFVFSEIKGRRSL